MAKFYGKLKALELSSESKPIHPLTKQKWNESLFLIRGKTEGIPAWHYILVPYNKIIDLKNHKSNEIIDCTEFGRVIQYRDNNGEINQSSGWGIDPSYSFRTWIEDYYSDGSFDENTKFEYEKDDIRLCTMQRLTSSQLIGIYQHYNKQGNFHYIKLIDDFQSSLAYRAGIRNYDRFISLNGVNIEQDTLDKLTKRFRSQLNLPVQILVCSPSTYHYYKSNNMIIHSDLPTVQHLKPVFDISCNRTNYLINECFCVIQWENSDTMCVIPQSSIFKSPDFIQINDICFIEIEGKYRRGIIKFKGSKNQCENIRNDLTTQLNNVSIEKYSTYYQLNDTNSTSEFTRNTKILSDKIIPNEKSQLEDLPNELLYDLFNYLTHEDTHNCFLNLNNRLNNLLLSRYNISLIYDSNINILLIKFYQFEINHLIIDTSNSCDLKLFPNLSSLTICNRNLNHIKQLQPEIFPNLLYLSFLLKSNFKPPIELVNQIFSNQFRSLRSINLGLIENSSRTWLICPCLKRISISCNKLMIINDILQSCPNLNHLQINILYNSNISMIYSSTFSHSLERFTLSSKGFELTFDLINILFNLMPNLKRLYLQTQCRIPFIYLIKNLLRKLKNFSHFECFIKELLIKNERIGNLNDIHQIGSCFQRIQCVKENEDFRTFATD